MVAKAQVQLKDFVGRLGILIVVGFYFCHN